MAKGRDFAEAEKAYGAKWATLNYLDKDVWKSLELQSHHGVPRHVSEVWLNILDPDSSPAFLTVMHNHTREIDSLHRIIEKHLPITGPRPPLTNAQIVDKLKDAYDEAGMSEFWGLCEDWLRAKGAIP